MRFLLLALLLTTAADAQDSSEAAPPDLRVANALGELGYLYEMDAAGSFALTFDIVNDDEESTRVQTIYIRSEVTAFSGFEVRELYSIVAGPAADGVIDADLARRLLEENPQSRFGAWGTEAGYVVLTATLPSDAAPDALSSAMMMILTSADDLEAELSDGADEW